MLSLLHFHNIMLLCLYSYYLHFHSLMNELYYIFIIHMMLLYFMSLPSYNFMLLLSYNMLSLDNLMLHFTYNYFIIIYMILSFLMDNNFMPYNYYNLSLTLLLCIFRFHMLHMHSLMPHYSFMLFLLLILHIGLDRL